MLSGHVGNDEHSADRGWSAAIADSRRQPTADHPDDDKPILPSIPQLRWDSFVEPQPNTVQYWGFFSREELIQNAGRLMMLDIDFGRECSLHCPACFRRRNVVDDSGDPDLTYDELLGVLQQARELGLKCVKICGAGEPFENPNLLKLARTLSGWDIGLSIFTKGHVLGDDVLAARVFAREGITNGRSLAERLFELKTSLLVSFQSFRPAVQDRLVGNVGGHTLRRNRAVEMLADLGFNHCSPTRLAFCTNPITRSNYGELFAIYKYCRERNILPVIAALMVSGKQFGEQRYLDRIDVTAEDKLDLWARVYSYNVEQGIQSISEIEHDGISALPGVHPCNQIACGMYVTANGNVLSCPGNVDQSLGSLRHTSLFDIWRNSATVGRPTAFNCACPPKTGCTIPPTLFSRVLTRVVGRHGGGLRNTASGDSLQDLSRCQR